MSWQIKDEWIDLARARHVVVFHNPDLGPDAEPHLLIHEFNVKACAHCGHAKVDAQGEPLDFQQLKAETHAALNAHHSKVMKYRAKHPHVRIASEPQP